jgi:hypothetical protein
LILWAWGMGYIFYWYYMKVFTWICVVCLTIGNKVIDINLSIYLHFWNINLFVTCVSLWKWRLSSTVKHLYKLILHLWSKVITHLVSNFNDCRPIIFSLSAQSIFRHPWVVIYQHTQSPSPPQTNNNLTARHVSV